VNDNGTLGEQTERRHEQEDCDNDKGPEKNPLTSRQLRHVTSPFAAI
jgi:hypothetical protein